ncbi:MAG: cysteine--tRNA ligase [Thermodesulfobacteriota bacterium]|nr:cysteine--tRNA ligase [Thermodesulfobacteriota bacterium]
MTLYIYNVLSGKKEVFEPLKPGKVGMYVCGPTVYGPCHIGHARSVVVFDVIARYFRETGYDVTYVRNFTDVDDKIIDKANAEGVSSQAVAEKYIKEFYEDMDALFVERATIEPRATEHIADIIHVIEKLIKKGIAYAVDGDVFFSVADFPGYGKLSGRRLEDMEAGARVEVDKKKKNPFDFVLWKAEKPGEPAWDSPWGRGRPGWHIECSAMSSEFLGETFDIHGGGKDLIFPHHENEIAQSEAAFDKPFARFWVHNGFVRINQEKMSKSLNNYKMVKDIVMEYHPEAIRLFLLSNHYRSPVDFTETSMHDATAGLEKLYTALGRIEENNDLCPDMNPDAQGGGEFWERFCGAMDDDFNTAKGIGSLFEAARQINKLMDSGDTGDVLCDTMGDMRKMGRILGLFNSSAKAYFETQRTHAAAKGSVDPAEIEAMIQARADARKARDFAAADQIRDQLIEMDIVLEDLPDGTTTWKINS